MIITFYCVLFIIKPLIIGYLRDNNNIDLETLKNTILKNKEKYEKEHNKNREENTIIESSISNSGRSNGFIKWGGDFSY